SSRRRHTRSYGDWSSDVCSSDLHLAVVPEARGRGAGSALLAEVLRLADGVVFGEVREGDEPSLAWVVARGFVEIEREREVVLERSEERRVGKGCRGGWWVEL